MQFDLGLYGLGILVGSSLLFGVGAQLVLGSVTRWMWLIGAVAYFIGGLFMSEVMFATATVDDVQPMIDGLALDESVLGGLIVGLVAVLAVRLWLGTSGPFHHRPTPA